MTTQTVSAHEMTPTYPEFGDTYLADDVVVTHMNLFNVREEIQFYEIKVYNKDWEPVPFATLERIINVKYKEHHKFPVFVKRKDLDKVVYICTLSKLVKGSIEGTGISSRICSKVKRE